MTGLPPRRPAFGSSILRAAGVGCAVACGAILAVFPVRASAQSPADQPALPSSPDGGPSVSTDPYAPTLPPYSPSNDPASPLLPASPPLAPRPSVPTLSLLPPDSTPPPASPPPLPVPDQTGTSLSPTAAGNVLTNGGTGTTPATEISGGAAATNLTANTRRFQYAFRLSTGITYDDNLFLTSDNTPKAAGAAAPINNTPRRKLSRQDVFLSLDPSVSLGYGDFLTRATNYVEFDYNADVLFFTKNSDQDTVQHFVTLQGAYHFAQITLSLSQNVQIINSAEIGAASTGSQLGGAGGGAPTGPSTQVNLDASQRTALDVFTTRLSANYAISEKTSVDLEGYFSAYDYQTLISSDTLSSNAFFNYSLTGKITLGLGVTGGYIIQDKPAPNEAFEQGNLRLSYSATGKLTFSGSVGIEFRETGGTNGGTEVNPIFDLTVNYVPFDSTSLALTANRHIETSAVLTGANFDTTGLTFTLSQRFLQRIYTRLSLGYTHSSYVVAGGGANFNRTDDYYFVQPSLDYSIRQYLSVDLFYSRRQSVSSLSGNNFSDNQIGARLSLSF